jgi:glycosyltransferase involved in cell wall biosynthesis
MMKNKLIKKDISIIIPVFNESLSLKILYSQCIEAINDIFANFEIIFIDDGSFDNSFDILKNISDNDRNVIIIKMNRNYGKSDALNEGFKIAKFDTIVTLDADLQDDPEEIPKLVELLYEGWDCVSGWKKNRKDPLSKTIPSSVFNKVMSYMTGLKIHDLNCGIKAYKKEAIKTLYLYGGLHRYIPLLLVNNGYKITEKIVKHKPRMHGETKYGNSRFFHGIFDFLTISFLKKYFNRPMYFFGSIGLFLSLLGFIINIYLTVKWFNGIWINPSGSPLFFLGILLIVVGIQSLSIGLLGELIVSTIKSKDKVNKIINKR